MSTTRFCTVSKEQVVMLIPKAFQRLLRNIYEVMFNLPLAISSEHFSLVSSLCSRDSGILVLAIASALNIFPSLTT